MKSFIEISLLGYLEVFQRCLNQDTNLIIKFTQLRKLVLNVKKKKKVPNSQLLSQL